MAQDVSRDQFAVIKIEGMHCHRCEAAIKKSLAKHLGVHEVEIDFASGQASVLFNQRIVSVEQMLKTIEEAGYHASGYTMGAANT